VRMRGLDLSRVKRVFFVYCDATYLLVSSI